MSSKQTFDPNYYVLFNGDNIVLSDFDDKSIQNHWKKYGQEFICNKEMLFDKYPFMIDFDTNYYAEQNEGVSTLTNDAAIYYHYINIGSKEYYSVVFKELCFSLINTSPFVSHIPPKFDLTVVLHIEVVPKNVPQALESIMYQSYTNFQLIVVASAEIMKISAVSKALNTLTDYDNRIRLTKSFTKSMIKGTHVLIHSNTHMSLPTRFAKMMTELTKAPSISKVKLVSHYIMKSHLDDFKDVDLGCHYDIINAMYASPYKKKDGEGFHEHLLVNECMVSADVFRKLRYDTLMVDFFNLYYKKEFTHIYEAFRYMEDNDAAIHHVFIKEILCIRSAI